MKITDDTVTMSKRDFINEHKHLVKVLQSRQHPHLKEEAEEQGAELAKVQASE